MPKAVLSPAKRMTGANMRSSRVGTNELMAAAASMAPAIAFERL